MMFEPTTKEDFMLLLTMPEPRYQSYTFWAQSVTVHPFFRPDSGVERVKGNYILFRASGENRTKHSTTLGAAVGEMVEALA